jgi:hypothetical protein
MEIKLALYLDMDIDRNKKSNIMTNLDNTLELYFKDKSYDEDLETILVGLIAIRKVAGYENWYKPRKRKYTYYKVLKDPFFKDKTYEINKTYVCEFRLSEDDYEKFILSPEKESKLILGSYILQTLSDLDYLCKKLKQFKKNEFLTDLEKCLETNEYL